MTKTDLMLIGSRRRLSNVTASPTFAVNDFPVTTVKSLGVTIDENLDWASHIENIIKKVAPGIRAIKRVRHLIPQATLHLIHRSLVLPYFNYCITVWGNCGITLRNKLQKLRNRASRVITFSEYDTDVGYSFELLIWQNLTRLLEIDKATMVHKS